MKESWTNFYIYFYVTENMSISQYIIRKKATQENQNVKRKSQQTRLIEKALIKLT